MSKDDRKPRLVVGLDGSDGSMKALHWAAGRVDQFGKIQTVTAWHYPWWASAVPTTDSDVHQKESAFTHNVEVAVEQMLADVPFEDREPPLIVRDAAGPSLVHAAETGDLLVVGTRGRSAIADTMLGSVSMHCVAHAQVPVVVVPLHAPLDDESQQVIVGVDGSPNSVDALVWAMEHVPAYSKIEAVYAWGLSPVVVPDLAAAHVEREVRSAEDLIDRTILAAEQRVVASARRPVSRRAVGGDPRRVLEDAASGHDLLVIGARGDGGVAHLLLGSVATALCHQPVVATVVV